MALKNLYADIYQKFMEGRTAYKGYDFQHSPSGSASPPPSTFLGKLRWWTLNRPRRIKTIRQERDRLQQTIVTIKDPPHSSP